MVKNWSGAIIGSSHIFRDMLSDHLTRSGFCILLSEKSARNMIEALPTQAVALDFILWHSLTGMEDSSELALVGEFHRQAPNVKIIMLTDLTHQDSGACLRSAALCDAGIQRVLSRDIPGAALKHILALILLEQNTEMFLQGAKAPASAEPAPRSISWLRESSPAQPPAPATKRRNPAFGAPPPGKQPNLSDREQQILACLVQGLANKAIGRKLDIAEGTVKVHIKSLLRKIKVCNRTQAAIWALDCAAEEDNVALANGKMSVASS